MIDKLNKPSIVLVAIVLDVLVMTTISSGVGTMSVLAKGSGFLDGRRQANSDFRSGNTYDDSCSIDLSHSYCLAYKAGYAFEWAALHTLH